LAHASFNVTSEARILSKHLIRSLYAVKDDAFLHEISVIIVLWNTII